MLKSKINLISSSFQESMKGYIILSIENTNYMQTHKYYKAILLCLFTFPFFSQEIVTYDEETQLLCIDIHSCDPCILGEENSQICYCREDCNDVADEFLIDCLQTANGLLDIQRCKDLAAQRVHFCKEECGKEVEWPYIDHIQLRLRALGSPIPLHPLMEFNEEGDYQDLGGQSYGIDEGKQELHNFYKFNDNCVNLSEHDLTDLNFCLTYDIRILIGESGTDERRECIYSDTFCIIK